MAGKESARPSLAARRAVKNDEPSVNGGAWDFKAEAAMIVIFIAFELFIFVCEVAF